MLKIFDKRFNRFIDEIPENFTISFNNNSYVFYWECCDKKVKVDHFIITHRVATINGVDIFDKDVIEVKNMLSNGSENFHYIGEVFTNQKNIPTFGDSNNDFGFDEIYSKFNDIKTFNIIGNLLENPELEEKIGKTYNQKGEEK